MKFLEIKGLKVYFHLNRGTLKAVDGVDLVLDKGETLGIIGESGCGKSVTGLSILRLVQPPGQIVAGSINFMGTNLLKLNNKEIRKIRGNKISMIFQDPVSSVNPVLKIGFQIAEIIELHQKLSRRNAEQKAIEMLKIVGIAEPKTVINNYPYQLSGGMLQRVMIAIALSCNPSILIADEPTTALDVTIEAQILDLMNNLKEKIGMSIILISHNMGIIAENSRHIAVMYAGKIVEYADTISLYNNPLHPYTVGLLRSSIIDKRSTRKKQTFYTINGTVPNLINTTNGCNFSNRCPDCISKCIEEQPMLREIEPGHKVSCWKYW